MATLFAAIGGGALLGGWAPRLGPLAGAWMGRVTPVLVALQGVAVGGAPEVVAQLPVLGLRASAELGFVGVASHAGQIITGRRSTSVRTRSKEKLPAPTMIEARNSTTSRPLARRIAPTSCRLRRWAENRSSSSAPSPPR
jgi:hypothetical protein